MNNVTARGTLSWDSVVRVPCDGKKLQIYALEPRDVVFNNTNSTELVGKSSLFNGYSEPVVFSNHFTRLRPVQTRLLPEFLAHWLKAQWEERIFETICNRWIGQSAVQRDTLLALSIPLPPLPEQRRSAALLTEQLAAVDQARAAAEAQLRAVRELPAAYLRATFGGAEAQQWPKVRLGRVLQLRKEVVHPRDNPVGTATFVGLEHVEGGTGRRIGSVGVDLAQLSGRKPRFYVGDIVYGYLRPYLNKVWLADSDGLCSVDQYVYSVDRSLADPMFIAWYMRSPIYLAAAPINTTPGQLPRIRTEEVAGVEIHLPPLAVQERMLDRFTKHMRDVDLARTALEAQLAAINALPSTLLRRAFSGELSAEGSVSVRDGVQVGIIPAPVALAAYIVQDMHSSITLGRVKLQKFLYLTETYLDVPLGGTYRRAAAGPYDGPFLAQLEREAEQGGWIHTFEQDDRIYYQPGTRIAECLPIAARLLGDKQPEMDRLLTLLRSSRTTRVEMIATLFGVWNDFLLDGVLPSDEQIVREVREHWHVKKQRFAPDDLLGALSWMRSVRLVPRGTGPHTMLGTVDSSAAEPEWAGD